MHRSKYLVGLLGAALAYGMTLSGCSSNEDSGNTDGSGSTGSGTGSTGSGTGGGTGSGTGGGTAISGPTPPSPRSCAGIPLSERAEYLTSEQDVACTGASLEPEGLPVDVFIMMDRSVSMTYDTEGFDTRWDGIRAAVEAFVNEPAASNIGIGIGFFSIDGGSGTTANCNVGNYAEPAVGIGLPGAVGADILQAIDETFPAGLTPTAPALEGAIQYAKSYHQAHPERETLVLLVTDGYPTLCMDDDPISQIAQVAADGFDGNPSIRTFVVGLEAGFNLDQIAMWGGTNASYNIEAGTNISDAFVDRLLSLASSDLACTIELPPPDSPSEEFDPDSIVVRRDSPLGVAEEIPKASGEAACDGTFGGWYFPDPTNNPRKIKLCPCTCSRLGGGSLTVAAGCTPVTIIG